jgi:hypothetical protein
MRCCGEDGEDNDWIFIQLGCEVRADVGCVTAKQWEGEEATLILLQLRWLYEVSVMLLEQRRKGRDESNQRICCRKRRDVFALWQIQRQQLLNGRQ